MGVLDDLLRFTIKGSDYFQAPRIDGGRARDPALYTPYSKNKATGTAPYDYVVSGTRNVGLLDNPLVIKPEDLQNKLMFFATGDRTSNQRMIEEINDYLLRSPQTTYGGPEYMDQIDTGAWASEFSALAPKAKAMRRAQDEGQDVVLSYMPMGERSGDFSQHMSDVYTSMMQSGGNVGSWRNNISDIDMALRKRFPDMNIPSVGSKDFGTWLSSQKGGTRSQFIKYFDSSEMQKLGMPDVGVARFAVTDPNLVLSDAGSVGYRFAFPELDVTAVRNNPHPSYNSEIRMMPDTRSMTFGDLELPFTIGARDTALPKAAVTGNINLMPKDIKSYMQNPNLSQLIDDQFLTEAGTYSELLRGAGKPRADEYATGLLQSFIDRQ